MHEKISLIFWFRCEVIHIRAKITKVEENVILGIKFKNDAEKISGSGKLSNWQKSQKSIGKILGNGKWKAIPWA